MRSFLQAGIALALAQPLVAQVTWTVDDNGPADFASVQAAVDAAGAGDVILIEPGSYGNVVVAKPLSLLGNPATTRPTLQILTIHTVAWFNASHLSARAVHVSDVSGPAHLDDIDADSTFSGHMSTVAGAANLLISRSDFRPQNISGGIGIPGLSITANSRVQLVDCRVFGGDCFMSDFDPGWGADALTIEHSEVVLAGTRVEGGDGQDLSGPFGPQDGEGGVAIRVAGNSTVEVRGSSADLIQGGHQNPSGFTDPAASIYTWDFQNEPRVTVSGVTLDGGVVEDGGDDVAAVGALPYLEVTGGPDGPGGTRSLDVYGEAGAASVTLAATRSLWESAFEAFYSMPLFLDPSKIVATFVDTLAGQDTAASQGLTLPGTPGLSGIGVTFQAFVLGKSGVVTSTNGAGILLSY